MGWAEEEFETLDLGDTRLNRRAVLLAERLSQKPGASIPADLLFEADEWRAAFILNKKPAPITHPVIHKSL